MRLELLWAAICFVFSGKTKTLHFSKGAIADFGRKGLTASYAVMNTDRPSPDGRLGVWEDWTVTFDGRKVEAFIDAKLVASSDGVLVTIADPSR